MARVTYSGMVASIDGSVGGTTFQKNKSGNIAHLRRGGTRKATTKQSLQQQNLSGLVGSWQALSAANKNSWISYASSWTKVGRYGTTKTLTGMNWYICINSNRLILGQAVTNTPPAHTLPIAVPMFIPLVTSTQMLLTPIIPFINLNSSLILCTTPPISRTSVLQLKSIRLTKITAPSIIALIDFKTAWETTHGITLATVANGGNWSIGIQLFQIQQTSGINGVALNLNTPLT